MATRPAGKPVFFTGGRSGIGRPLVANGANIMNRCFGESKTGFTITGACAYGLVANGAAGATTNIARFSVYVNARIKR